MTAFRRELVRATCLLVLVVTPVVAFAQAEEVVLSVNMGGVREDGTATNAATYPLCGRTEAGTKIRISGGARLAQEMPFASALRLELVGAFFHGGYATIDVFSVDNQPTISPAYYADLGNGTQFGTVYVTTANRWKVVTIQLNEATVAAFNNVPRRICLPDGEGGVYCQTGYFRFGMSVREPFSTASGTNGMSFEGAGHRLVVTPVALAVESTTWGRVKALYRN